MKENTIINGETVNNVCEEVSNTKGGVIVKIAVAAIGLAAGIGTALFIRKRRQKHNDCTETEVIVSENDQINEE